MCNGNIKCFPSLSSAEFHPQPRLRCWMGSSTPLWEPTPMLQLSAWLCLWCDFGIFPSCMQLCTWLCSKGKGFSFQPPSVPMCMYRPAGGQGSSTPTASDPS